MTSHNIINKPTLHPFQQDIAKRAFDLKTAALFLHMGVGKTAIALDIIDRILTQNPHYRVLIIAPKPLVSTTWPQEAGKFQYDFNLNYHFNSQLNSTYRLKMFHKYDEEANITLLSITMLHWFFNNDLLKNYQALIIDESSKMKSYRNQKVKTITHPSILSLFEYRYIMTGTPIPNGYLDLWTQMYIVDKGQRLGATYRTYLRRFFDKQDYIKFKKYHLKPGAETQIIDLIKDITITCDETVVSQNLPPFIPTVLVNNLPIHLVNDYKKLKKEFILECKKEENSSTLVCSNTSDLINKLMQYSSGFVYVTNEETNERTIHDIHNEKIQLLSQVLATYSTEKILLAYNFKHEATMILQHFPSEVTKYEDPRTVMNWQQNLTNRVLLVNPVSIAHGLNLQYDSHIIVWYSYTWNLENYLQFNKRLLRQGQRHPVYCIHLAIGDIEYKIMNRITQKETTQQDLFTYLKTCGTEALSIGFTC